MPDPRARRGLPDRWLLPPPPRDPDLARRWHARPFGTRRALARIDREQLRDVPPEDAEVVVGLARARLATSWRLLAGAPLLGWLVLMTVWGFGRSTYPGSERAWLWSGLALGAVVWGAAAVHAAGRLRRARVLVGTVPGDDDRGV